VSSGSKTGRPRPRIGSPGGISYRRPWPTLGCRVKYDDDGVKHFHNLQLNKNYFLINKTKKILKMLKQIIKKIFLKNIIHEDNAYYCNCKLKRNKF